MCAHTHAISNDKSIRATLREVYTPRNNWKPLFEVNISQKFTTTIKLFALDLYEVIVDSDSDSVLLCLQSDTLCLVVSLINLLCLVVFCMCFVLTLSFVVLQLRLLFMVVCNGVLLCCDVLGCDFRLRIASILTKVSSVVFLKVRYG